MTAQPVYQPKQLVPNLGLIGRNFLYERVDRTPDQDTDSDEDPDECADRDQHGDAGRHAISSEPEYKRPRHHG